MTTEPRPTWPCIHCGTPLDQCGDPPCCDYDDHPYPTGRDGLDTELRHGWMDALASIEAAVWKLPTTGYPEHVRRSAVLRLIAAARDGIGAASETRTEPVTPCHCGRPWVDHDLHYPEGAR